jgi:hypothetical protein
MVSCLQAFQPKFRMHFSSPHARAHSAHLILLGLIILITFRKEYKLRSSPLCNFPQPSATSTLLGPNILLSTLFSNIKMQQLCPSQLQHVMVVENCIGYAPAPPPPQIYILLLYIRGAGIAQSDYGLDDRAIEVRSPAEAKRFFL